MSPRALRLAAAIAALACALVAGPARAQDAGTVETVYTGNRIGGRLATCTLGSVLQDRR